MRPEVRPLQPSQPEQDDDQDDKQDDEQDDEQGAQEQGHNNSLSLNNRLQFSLLCLRDKTA